MIWVWGMCDAGRRCGVWILMHAQMCVMCMQEQCVEEQ